jgi:putative ABC transport system permease protein
MWRRAFFIAYRQLTQRIAKLIAALMGVTVAIVLMFMQLGFENALYDSALNVPDALDADLIIAAPDFSSLFYSPPWFARSIVFETRGIDGVASARPLYAMVLAIKDTTGKGARPVWLFGLPPGERTMLNGEVNRQIDLISEPGVVILDRQSRRDFNPLVRDVGTLGRADVIVPMGGANLQYTVSARGMFSLGPTFMVDGTIITSDINFTRMTGQALDRVSLGLIRLKPGVDVQQEKALLQQKLGPRNRVFTKAEFGENERDYYANRTPIGYIFRLGLMVGVVVGIVFILQALHGIINDNMTEYAVMRAMGYHQTFFWMLIGNITAGFVVLAYIPSLFVTALLYWIATNAIQLPMNQKPGDAILVLGLVIIMGGSAAMIAIRKLRKASPVDLFS